MLLRHFGLSRLIDDGFPCSCCLLLLQLTEDSKCFPFFREQAGFVQIQLALISLKSKIHFKQICCFLFSVFSAGLETERGQESTAFILMRGALFKINTTRINDLKLLICRQRYADTVSLVPHCFEMLTFMTGITSGETIAVLLSLFIFVKPFCQSESRRQSAIYSRCACL